MALAPESLDTAVTALGQAIQLAIAPVFLLAGIGSFLNVCVGRLARIVDRSHTLHEVSCPRPANALDEIRALDRRMVLVRHAISVAVVAAVLICAMIILLFTARLLTMQLGTPIALLFIAAMVAVGAGYGIFLVETRLATRFIRIRHEVLKRQSGADR